MKNKAEREAFLKDYRTNFMFFAAIHTLGLEFYNHIFANGAEVIVTEYEKMHSNGEIYLAARYHLRLPEGDNYNPFDQNSGHTPAEFRTYTLEGCGIGTIVDYMTKRRDVI